MDIIKNFIDSDNPIVNAIASKVGLDKDQISSLVEGLVPELNNGVQSKVSEGASGIQSLINGLDLSSLAKLVGGNSEGVAESEASSMGATLLKNILGGEEGVGSIISNLTSSTGISADKVGEVVPSITTAFMSFFSNNAGGVGEMFQSLTGGEGSIMENVTSLLDKDGDGQVVDDLLDAAKKLF